MTNQGVTTSNISHIKRIDEENDSFFKESIEDVVRGKMTIRDILGFEIKKPAVLMPSPPCGHLASSVASRCAWISEKPTTSIFSLLPLYDALVYPIQPKRDKEIVSEAAFETAHDISLKDFLSIAERGKIIPYFPRGYSDYDVNLIGHFLEPGLPRISAAHMSLIEKMNVCSIVNSDCGRCREMTATSRKDITEVFKRPLTEKDKGCYSCLALAYSNGITKDQIMQLKHPEATLCLFSEIFSSRNLDSVFKSNCPLADDALGVFSGLRTNERAIETIVSGLKVKYTAELDLESYLSVLDGRTTRAVREIVKKILDDPFAAKYSEALNSKVFEFNREIGELATSRSAAFYEAVSEIAVYGGTKFIERQSEGFLKARKKDLGRVEEWIASKMMDVHAKVTGKDWTIAQLYKTRCKIEQCGKKVKAA